MFCLLRSRLACFVSCLSPCLSVSLFVCVPLFVCLSHCLSVGLCLCVSLFVCLTVCLSLLVRLLLEEGLGVCSYIWMFVVLSYFSLTDDQTHFWLHFFFFWLIGLCLSESVFVSLSGECSPIGCLSVFVELFYYHECLLSYMFDYLFCCLPSIRMCSCVSNPFLLDRSFCIKKE